jgi:predicted Zn-dependent protease
MGTVIATRAGYDSYGLMAVLLKLESMNPADGSLALMFKTHPSPTKRIEKLDGLMSRHMRSDGNAAAGRQRFVQHVAKPK